jgi:hypothetical protein
VELPSIRAWGTVLERGLLVHEYERAMLVQCLSPRHPGLEVDEEANEDAEASLVPVFYVLD